MTNSVVHTVHLKSFLPCVFKLATDDAALKFICVVMYKLCCVSDPSIYNMCCLNREERDYRSSQRGFGRGSRGGGRGRPSGHRIPSRDFDDDRYRSEDYSNRRYSGAATHLVDGFRARRSPAPRNFGHRELRSSDRYHASELAVSRGEYGDDRSLRDDRR